MSQTGIQQLFINKTFVLVISSEVDYPVPLLIGRHAWRRMKDANTLRDVLFCRRWKKTGEQLPSTTNV